MKVSSKGTAAGITRFACRTQGRGFIDEAEASPLFFFGDAFVQSADFKTADCGVLEVMLIRDDAYKLLPMMQIYSTVLRLSMR